MSQLREAVFIVDDIRPTCFQENYLVPYCTIYRQAKIRAVVVGGWGEANPPTRTRTLTQTRGYNPKVMG